KPFYLVGRLGDQELTISASGAALKVKVGAEETTIPLSKETDHDEGTRSSRWDARRGAQEAPAPADAEVAQDEGSGRDREEPLPDGALGALGGDAGERCGRAGEDLAGHLLPDGDASAQRDAGGAEPAGFGLGSGRAGSVGGGSAYQRARGAGEGPGAGQAPQPAAAPSRTQVDALAGEPWPSWPAAEACAARPEPEWQARLEAPEGEGESERPFDPDEGWRERPLSWERKLAGADALGDAAIAEGRDEEEQDLHPGAEGGAGADAAPGADAGGAGRKDYGVAGGANAGHVAQSLPDDPAPGVDGLGRGDWAQGGRAPGEVGGAERLGGASRAPASGERTTPGACRDHGSSARSGERSSARAHQTDGPCGAEEKDQGRPR